MNANASPIATPLSDRYRTAASNVARGEVSCFARIPLTFAGDRRKSLGGIERSITQSAHGLFQELLAFLAVAVATAPHQIVGAAELRDDVEQPSEKSMRIVS